MNSLIENLNQLGGTFLSFALPMLWQSSLLITILFAFDFLVGRKLRASIRYALWLVVLVKLCVPPPLALPTSPAWWLHQTPPPVVVKSAPHYTVTYDETPLPVVPQTPLPVFVPPKPVMNLTALLLVVSIAVSLTLLGWLLVRWWQITRQVRRANSSGRLTALADETQKKLGTKFKVQVKLTTNAMSPAVCGLFRPAILIPQSLAENFSDEQLRAVLLHELIHLRRRDVWVNCLQALLQIFYWWHPLVWVANARIRRVREEAVDDAVMLALRDEAEAYAPTLLEVAKLALNRPLVSLGLVGIMESRYALRQRIERLVDFRAPRHAGLTLVSLLGILAFTAVAVPMGEAPTPAEKEADQNTNADTTTGTGILSNPNFKMVQHALEQRNGVESLAEPEVVTSSGRGENRISMPNISVPFAVLQNTNRPSVLVTAHFYQAPPAEFGQIAALLKFNQGKENLDSWWSVPADVFSQTHEKINAAAFQRISAPRVLTFSGETAEMFVGNDTNSVSFSCQPVVVDGLIDLTMRGKTIDQRAGIAVTNQFKTKSTVENHGGMVIRVEKSGAPTASNLVVFIGVEIVTNTARFQQRLQAVVKHADGTNFPASGSVTNLLFSRVFAVDPHTFVASLKAAGVDIGGSTNSAEQIVPALKNFFASLGVDLKSPPGKAIFYGDKLGKLFVKATSADLDTIERAIEVLNSVPPQIHIKARFVQVTRNRNGAAGVDWYLGHFNVSNNVSGNGGSLASPNVPVSAANPLGTFPGKTAASVGSVSNSAPMAGQVMGILADANFRVTLHALENRPDAEVLAEPEVTTTSGRQTQMRATQVITVVTNFAFRESLTNNGTSSIFPETQSVETGPILDVVPYVLADGYTINLTVIPSLTEFLGYDKPPDVPDVTGTNNRVQLPIVLPKFDVRSVTANLNLWDNQTVVIGGMNSTSVSVTKDKTPVLGDIPLMGKLFRSQSKTTVEKELLVFITATIVDPAGNRVHKEDELPFAHRGIPPADEKLPFAQKGTPPPAQSK